MIKRLRIRPTRLLRYKSAKRKENGIRRASCGQLNERLGRFIRRITNLRKVS